MYCHQLCAITGNVKSVVGISSIQCRISRFSADECPVCFASSASILCSPSDVVWCKRKRVAHIITRTHPILRHVNGRRCSMRAMDSMLEGVLVHVFTLVALPCGHQVCCKCIDNVLLFGTCPLCREPTAPYAVPKPFVLLPAKRVAHNFVHSVILNSDTNYVNPDYTATGLTLFLRALAGFFTDALRSKEQEQARQPDILRV